MSLGFRVQGLWVLDFGCEGEWGSERKGRGLRGHGEVNASTIPRAWGLGEGISRIAGAYVGIM